MSFRRFCLVERAWEIESQHISADKLTSLADIATSLAHPLTQTCSNGRIEAWQQRLDKEEALVRDLEAKIAQRLEA